MANGDIAASAGLDTVDGNTQDIRLAYDEENKGRDYLATHMLTGGHPLANMTGILPLVKGGTGAAAATTAAARAALEITAQNIPTNGSNVQGDLDYINGKADTAVASSAGKRDQGDGNFGQTPIVTPYGRSNPVSTSYVAAYINSDGRLGATPSAARFKQDITPKQYGLDDIARIVTVTYRLKDAVAEHGDAAAVEAGIIAEQLIEAGFPEFVVYGFDGQVFTIDYARLVVVSLSAVQQLNTAYTDLNRRITALEPNDDERTA